MNKFDRKLIGKGAVRTWKGFTLSISNEDISDIIKIIKSLEDSGVWGYWIRENEIKNQEEKFLGALLAPLATSLV